MAIQTAGWVDRRSSAFPAGLPRSRLTAFGQRQPPGPRKHRNEYVELGATNKLKFATSASLREEYGDILWTATILQVHCALCLGRLLYHLRYELGLKRPLFREIWSKFNPESDFILTPLEPPAQTVIVDTASQNLQSEVNKIYGTYDVGLECDYDLRSVYGRAWFLEKRTTHGCLSDRLIEKSGPQNIDPGVQMEGSIVVEADHVMADLDEDEDIDSEDDEVDDPWDEYYPFENVEIQSCRSIRWTPAYMKREELCAMIVTLSHSDATSDANSWRGWRPWNGDRRRTMRKRSKLLQEEIWYVCRRPRGKPQCDRFSDY